MPENFTIDKLKVSVFEDVESLGSAAADYVQEKLGRAIAEKGFARLILATGASQFAFLEALKTRPIDWQKITVFHLDEYKGISAAHPASFRKYLKDRILDAVSPKEIHFLNGDAENLGQEMQRYSALLKEDAIDIACIGIGENGHIAFNDPPVADFSDPKWVKIVDLDDACRNQQLGEGWFPTIDDVPRQALTLTIPAIMRCKAISCVVPDARKAEAVHDTLYSAITTDCPATILRNHPETRLYLDRASAQKK